MPLYMDIHNLPEGTTPEDVAKAHAKDMETQRKYGVEYTKYWLNEKAGKVFCLCHAPNAEAAEQVHREAHGLLPDKIIEIQPELAEGFVGGVETNAAGAVVLSGGSADARDSGIRTVLFTDVVNSTTLTQSLGDEAALAMLGVHGMPKAVATARSVTPAHPTSASSSISAEHALCPSPPVAGWSPASTRAFPVSILQVIFSPTRPSALRVTNAVSGRSRYCALSGACNFLSSS